MMMYTVRKFPAYKACKNIKAYKAIALPYIH